MKNTKRATQIISIFILSLVYCFLLSTSIWADTNFDGWRVLPIRSQEEFDAGRIGGEGEQNMHGLARSLSNPNIIYASEDVAGPWKSTDAGETWKKTLGKGLYVNYSYSIEVDPVDPDIVFIVVVALWDGGTKNKFEGLYRSTDGGDNWEHVLNITLDAYDANYQSERRYQHNITYDSSSNTISKAKVWYAAFLNNSLYKSEDYGNSGSWVEVADLKAHKAIYEIEVNPADGSVFIASSNGLFKYTAAAGTQSLGNLPNGEVTSLEINPKNPNIIYAALKSSDAAITGLYKSIDKGNSFNLLKKKAASGTTLPHFFINKGYPDTIYLMGSRAWPESPTIITHDGGQTWIENTTQLTVRRWPGGPLETTYKKYLEGNSGAIVPNPQDENEAVGFFSNGEFKKTTDGGYNWTKTSTLFTGFAVWTNDGFVFDKFNPNRFALFLCDVIMAMTKTGGDWFYSITNTTDKGYIRGGWTTQSLIPSTGAIGSYSGDFEPVENSELMIATVGDYPVGQERVQVMRLENETAGWDVVSNIDIEKAEHLDKNRVFLSDITDKINKKDKIWSEDINDGEYVRITFKQNLTAKKRILISVNLSGLSQIEVYPKNSESLITKFVQSWQDLYTAVLTNLIQEDNVLDLKINGSAKLDYIVENKLYRMWFVGFNTLDPNIVYAGDLISHDKGKTFTEIKFKNSTGGSFSSLSPRIMGMCLSNPNVVYAMGGYSDTIFRSDDAGETWYRYTKPGWKFIITDPIPIFTADPVDCNKIYTIDANKDIAVFNGTTWSSLGLLNLIQNPASMSLSVRTIAVDPRNNSIIYAGIGATGVSNIWRSIDAGKTWQDISYNLPRTGAYPMAVNPHTGELFVGGGVGTRILPPPYESETLFYHKAYSMPSCADGLKNGDETGVDSGGSCDVSAGSLLYGDVNNDGEVTAFDAALTAQAAVGLMTLTPEQTQAADVSGDDEISAFDAALIAQRAVGLISKFPAEK